MASLQQVAQDMDPEDPPLVPPRPTEEEMSTTAKRRVQQQAHNKALSNEEGRKEEEEECSSPPREEKEQRTRGEQLPVRKPKKHNPFMPHVKARIQRNAREVPGSITTKGTVGGRTLFDQLEDFRLLDNEQPAECQDQDMDGVMQWWDTVERWEDLPPDDGMTDREEARALAVTVDKVQKGIRVFNKLFSERAEALWQHVLELQAIADGLDRFHKNTKIAQITGGSTSALGGVATIAGLALGPVTMGASLIVTAVGLAVATAGGLTSAGAGISNQVNHSLDRRRVEQLVEDYQDKMADINKCVTFVKQGMENLRRLDLLRMKKQAYGGDPPALATIFEDSAMAGKAILLNANEIMRVVQLANAAGSTAARAVQLASMATGVLTGLFVGMDLYFVAKDSRELRKGAKSVFAARIREVAAQLHHGLVELNAIRNELRASERTGQSERGTGGEA